MIVLSFLIAVAVLLLEGRFLAAIILRSRGEKVLAWTLGYPLGALLNTGVFFVFNQVHIPWNLGTIGGMHLILLALLSLLILRQPKDGFSLKQSDPIAIHPFLFAFSIAIVAVVVGSAALHALTIPSINWDVFTNWAMRAKISFYAGRFVTENVTQPQYPVLLHSLEMLPMYGAGFVDQLTKAMSLVLSLSGLGALFVLAMARVGKRGAIVTLAFLCAIPFAFEHLRQGYADIHWTMFALLSAITLDMAVEENDRRVLMLSAILIVAAGWTKLDGLYFGVAPWLATILFLAVRAKSFAFYRWPVGLCILLSVLWPLHVLLSGDIVSPHHTVLELHIDALGELLLSLFMRGTFGLYWWAIVAICVVAALQKTTRHLLCWQPSSLFGKFSALGIVLTYLFTSEVKGLLQGDNFSRVMLGATMILTLAMTLFLLRHSKKER